DDGAWGGEGKWVEGKKGERGAQAGEVKGGYAGRLAVQIAIEAERAPGEGRSGEPQRDFESVHGVQFSGSRRSAKGVPRGQLAGFSKLNVNAMRLPWQAFSRKPTEQASRATVSRD